MAVVKGISGINTHLKEGVKRGLTAAGMVAVQAVKQQMASGYDNPIWDTGATIQSVSYEVGQNQVSFGPSTDYAVFVHDGTYKMIDRPFISDVLENDSFIEGVKEVIIEQLHGI